MKWDEVELNSIAQIIAGQSPKSSFYNESGKGLPFFQGNADFGVLYPKVRVYTSQVTKISIPKDILISVRAPVGALNINIVECCIGRGLAAIRTSNSLDTKYLYYFLNWHRDKLKGIANGAVFEAITTEQLKRIKIPLPPLPIQEKIANILDKADALRSKDQELQAKYDELAQAIFVDMFGDPVRNEKGWEVRKLEELMTIVRGGSPRPIDKYLGGNIPWVKIGDATKGDDIYINKTKQGITEEGLNKTRYLTRGSVIFANCGVSLGFARILNIDGCIHDGWLAFSDIDESIVNKFFLLKSLNSVTDYFRKSAPDGTQPNLNTSIMKNFGLIIPPINLQIAFVQKIEIINALKAKANAEKSEELFQSLLQSSFK